MPSVPSSVKPLTTAEATVRLRAAVLRCSAAFLRSFRLNEAAARQEAKAAEADHRAEQLRREVTR